MPGLPIAGMDEGRGRRLPAMAAGITVIAAILIALGWWLLRTPEAPVSIVPPAVASAEAETGLITRTEDASVIDSAAAMSQPQTENTQVPLAIPQSPATTSQPVPARQPANTQVIAVTTPPSATAIQPPPTEAFQPRTPEPVPADSAPAATRSEPEFTVTTLEAVSAAAKSPPVVVGPPRPATPLVPLLTPRALVPTLPVQTAPAISLPITSAADSGIYMVAFSSLKVRHYVDPDYPRNSEGIRTAGWVDVNFGIDELGHTTGLQVTGAEPAGLFEDAALSAVRRWRFFPAKSPPGSGQAVRSEVRVRFTPD
jgi:protein TonB